MKYFDRWDFLLWVIRKTMKRVSMVRWRSLGRMLFRNLWGWG